MVLVHMGRMLAKSRAHRFLRPSILVTTNSTMAHTWSAQSRWECMERNAQRSSVVEFFVSYILTADLVFDNRERYHETATHISKSPFGCFLVMHATFSSVPFLNGLCPFVSFFISETFSLPRLSNR